MPGTKAEKTNRLHHNSAHLLFNVCVAGGGRVYALPVCPTHTIKICVPFTAADCSKMQMSCVTASLRLALKQPFGRLYYSVSGIRPVRCTGCCLCNERPASSWTTQTISAGAKRPSKLPESGDYFGSTKNINHFGYMTICSRLSFSCRVKVQDSGCVRGHYGDIMRL